MKVDGVRFARYAAGLRAVVEALWLSVYALVTAIIVNLTIPATSQGSELVDSLADAPNRFFATLTLIACALYCAAACAASSALAIRYGSLRKTTRTSALRARRAVPYWLAAAVVASCSALVLPLPVVAVAVPVVMLLGFFALPLAGDRGSGGPPSARVATIAAWWLAALGACAGAAVIGWPVSAPRTLGAWPIVYLGTGFWTIAGSVLFVVLPKRAGLPALMFVPLAIFIAFSGSNDNHAIRLGASTPEGPAVNGPEPLGAHFDAWLRRACRPSPHPCPVYLAAAQGGGARSAYWTASILEALDARSRGRFSRHLFAISAVSGGALGAAAYVASKSGENAAGVADRGAALRAFLSDDYLAPIVGALMFPDFIARFVPLPLPQFDRAATFELALERSWRNAFHSDRFSQDLNALYSGPGGDALPSLLLNATNVETGKRFVISNLAFAPADRGDAYYAYDPAAAYRIASMPLSTAVHLGARFPFISPHGVLEAIPKAGGGTAAWGRLVDGGYYDNSGTATLSDLLDALVRHVAVKPSRTPGIVPEFVVLVISSDVEAAETGTDERAFAAQRLPMMPPQHMMPAYQHFGGAPNRSLELSELNSPVEALLAARDAHAAAEQHHLAERVDDLATEGALHCEMSHLGASAACAPVPVFEEFSYAKALGSEDFAGLMNAMSHGSADRHAIVQLIKPGLGWTLSARSRHALDVLSTQAVERQTTSGAELP